MWRTYASLSDEEDDAEAGGGDSFDGDSELASPTTRSRKRSSAVERESVRSELHHANTLLSKPTPLTALTHARLQFSELPGLPEDLSEYPHYHFSRFLNI